MEIASNKGVIADASTPAGRAGMSESEWREAIKFDSTDTGWVIMSIGMAIGASPGAGRFDGIVGIFALIGDWLPGNVSVSAVVY